MIFYHPLKYNATLKFSVDLIKSSMLKFVNLPLGKYPPSKSPFDDPDDDDMGSSNLGLFGM